MTAPAEDPRGGDRVVARAVDSALRCETCGERCTSGLALREHTIRQHPAAGRGDTDSGGEHSTDLTPGVVWTDAQLAVVRDLTARAFRAQAAVSRVEAVIEIAATSERFGKPKVRGYQTPAMREVLAMLRRALDGP